MPNLLVAIDRTLEASFALRTACLFGTDLDIQPIYVFDPPGRDIAFGAGWARKSWERETSRQAEESIEDLVLAERSQCRNIHDPVVLTGDPIHEPSEYFWSGNFDLLIVGAPFRGMGPLDLCRRFSHVARKEHRVLPVMVVRHLKNIEKIVALTDGSDLAEKGLGLLLKLRGFVSGRTTLIGTGADLGTDAASEALHLERGMAILKENEIEAIGLRASTLGTEQLASLLKSADLLVNPLRRKDHLHFGYALHEAEIQALLVVLNGE